MAHDEVTKHAFTDATLALLLTLVLVVDSPQPLLQLLVVLRAVVTREVAEVFRLVLANLAVLKEAVNLLAGLVTDTGAVFLAFVVLIELSPDGTTSEVPSNELVPVRPDSTAKLSSVDSPVSHLALGPRKEVTHHVPGLDEGLTNVVLPRIEPTTSGLNVFALHLPVGAFQTLLDGSCRNAKLARNHADDALGVGVVTGPLENVESFVLGDVAIGHEGDEQHRPRVIVGDVA